MPAQSLLYNISDSDNYTPYSTLQIQNVKVIRKMVRRNPVVVM
jgi:hypothetical protein